MKATNPVVNVECFPSGIRCARITGTFHSALAHLVFYYFPFSAKSEIKKTKANKRRGVYLLFKNHLVATAGTPRLTGIDLYIGQASDVTKRPFDPHTGRFRWLKKPEWDEAVAIVSDAPAQLKLNLNALEGILINRAKANSSYVVDQKAKSTEAEDEDEVELMDGCADLAKIVLPNLGFPGGLSPLPGKATVATSSPSAVATHPPAPATTAATTPTTTTSSTTVTFNPPTRMPLVGAPPDIVDLHKRYSPSSILIGALSILNGTGRLSKKNVKDLLSGESSKAVGSFKPTIIPWTASSVKRYSKTITLRGKDYLITTDVHDRSKDKISHALQWGLDQGLTAKEIRTFCDSNVPGFRQGFVPAPPHLHHNKHEDVTCSNVYGILNRQSGHNSFIVCR